MKEIVAVDIVRYTGGNKVEVLILEMPKQLETQKLWPDPIKTHLCGHDLTHTYKQYIKSMLAQENKILGNDCKTHVQLQRKS